MPEQLSLFSMPEPSRPTDRLFFALFPDAETAERLARLAGQCRAREGLRGNLIAAARLHVTLQHLGDFPAFPERLAAAAREAGAEAAAESAPFEAAFSQAGSFAGRAGKKPYVLRCPEPPPALLHLRQRLGAALVKRGLRPDKGSTFVPHITLLYDDRLAPTQPVEPVRWRAHDFALVHSLLGQTRHIHLQRWPLAG